MLSGEYAVFTRTSERTTGTFSDAQGIHRCIRIQICNILYKCVESVVRQQKRIAHYPCVFFLAHGRPLLALAAAPTGPHSYDSLILDQNRHMLWHALSFFLTPFGGRLVLSHSIGYNLYYIIFVLSALL